MYNQRVSRRSRGLDISKINTKLIDYTCCMHTYYKTSNACMITTTNLVPVLNLVSFSIYMVWKHQFWTWKEVVSQNFFICKKFIGNQSLVELQNMIHIKLLPTPNYPIESERHN